MATFLKTLPFRELIPPRTPTTYIVSLKSPKPSCLSFGHKRIGTRISRTGSLRFAVRPSLRFVKFAPFASQGEAETAETEQAVQEPEIKHDPSDGAAGAKVGGGETQNIASSEDFTDTEKAQEATDAEKGPSSIIMASLYSYKEALANNDETRIAEIEAFLKSIEDEKIELETKLTALSEELSIEKDRILRISADFDNFRKRTERERLSLVTNAQGEVVENFLPVLDNFERAKAQIKVETEGEEKVNNSYQNIYKQFVEILGSLGVVPVEPIGKPFDPLLHEAIMREESVEFEEGIILEEYRKGFKLGDRLLRPSMVKVSAGPGPAKPEQAESSKPEAEDASEASEEGSSGSESS
uniref:GrpE protein homolog n=2 Tax=Rhizophora mucronata TaxID=61149 RepID=A0A2P2JTL4_RHIMU